MDDDARIDSVKILVVSLLRLGDILLATSVLRSIRREYPDSEIHILINGQFKNVAEMIPYTDKVYCFDRDAIQQILGASDRNILEAYFRVEDLIEQLKTESYKKVINLTHNRLSGWLTALIGCQDTRGVVYGKNGKLSVGSDWFDYLNDFVEPGRTNVFHFVDVFHYGSGINSSNRRIELQETPNGEAFAQKIFESFKDKKVVVIQPFSAENKKTFAPSKWKEIGQLLKSIDSQIELLILGSPQETSGVQEICDGENFHGIICDLAQAFSVLKRAQLLITGDTSIKHLAAATKIKILEVSLGSSEYLKTGAYKDGAIILQGLVACAPCSHRGPCTQKTHECAGKISPELVSMVASSMLRHDENALRVLAHEYQDDVLMARTCFNANGDWAAYPLGQNFNAKEINSWVDRASFKLYLQGAHRQTIGEYGSEGLHLKKLLENIFPDRSKNDWFIELKNLEKEVEWFDLQVESLLGRLKSLLGKFHEPGLLQDYLEEIEAFCVQTLKSNFSSYGRQLSWSFKDPKAPANHFELIKKLRERLSHAHQRTKIELKLIRGLQTDFREAL